MAQVSVAVPVFLAVEDALSTWFTGSAADAARHLAFLVVFGPTGPDNRLGMSVAELRAVLQREFKEPPWFLDEAFTLLEGLGVIRSTSAGWCVNPRVSSSAAAGAEAEDRARRFGWPLWLDGTAPYVGAAGRA